MRTFRLGAFIFPPDSIHICWDRRPVMCHVRAANLHLARRIFVEDVLSHGFCVREMHILTKYVRPFDQEIWEIS